MPSTPCTSRRGTNGRRRRARAPRASCSCATASISGRSCSRRCGCCATGCGWNSSPICCSSAASRSRCAGSASPSSARAVRSALLLALLVGLEASSLRRWKLSRRGFAQRRRRGRRRSGRRPSGASSTAGSARDERPAPRATPPAPPPSPFAAHAAVDRHHRAVPAAGGAAVTVAIVDYGSGNLHSAAKAFERAARESGSRPADRW